MSAFFQSQRASERVFPRKEKILRVEDIQNLDILFLIPPLLRFMGRSSGNFPLGLGYMVGYLQKQGISAKIYNTDLFPPAFKNNALTKTIHVLKSLLFPRALDFLKKIIRPNSTPNLDYARQWPEYHALVHDLNHPIWREIFEIIQKLNPRLIGISSRVVDLKSTLFLVGIVKKALPNSRVIVGGPSAITCSNDLLASPHIDFLVLGEGEQTILELASYLLERSPAKSLPEISGIAYKDQSGKTITNSPRPLIQNLDEIPFPDREGMLYVNHKGEIQEHIEAGDVISSRGCPYHCTFCCAFEAWGTRIPRFRTVQNIVEEVFFLNRTYGQKKFIFWDDLFTSSPKRTREFCQKIKKTGIRISWICVTRINSITSDLLEIMKDAGCEEIQVGIESGSDRILSLVKKALTQEEIRAKAKILRRSGMKWRIFLIIGFPGETKEEILATMDIISEIKPTFVDLAIFSPYPGTAIFEEMKAQNKLKQDFQKSDMWFIYNNFTGNVPDSEFEKLALEAFTYIDHYNARSWDSGMWKKPFSSLHYSGMAKQ